MTSKKRLFEVPPDRFVQARDALARELRDAGRADEAKEIAGLRKPPLALWIVNQLGRLSPSGVEAVVKATARVREAYGTGGDELREAMREHRDALARLDEVAVRGALEAGTTLTPALQRRVQATVQAAAAGAPEALREGSVEAELQPAGFEALLGISPAPRAAVPGRAAPGEDETARRKEQARLARDQRAREQAAQRLSARAARLEQAAARAEATAAKLRERAEAARSAANEAGARALELRGRQ